MSIVDPWSGVPSSPERARQPLIGVVGRMGAGKDTLGKILVDTYGFKRRAFADALKRVALETNPLVFSDRDDWAWEPVRLKEYVAVFGWEGAKRNPEVRRFLQQLGHAMRQHVHDDVWLDVVKRDVQFLLAEGIPTVITDLRYLNELEMVKRLGGVTVRVHRDPLGDDPNARFYSETALDGVQVDVEIDNTGSLDSLRLAAAELVERVI